MFSQRLPGQRRAEFEIVQVASDMIWIADVGRECMSVTNDAEDVVQRIHAEFPGRRIIYRDTMGNWDELVHRGGAFTGFAPARELGARIQDLADITRAIL